MWVNTRASIHFNAPIPVHPRNFLIISVGEVHGQQRCSRSIGGVSSVEAPLSCPTDRRPTLLFVQVLHAN